MFYCRNLVLSWILSPLLAGLAAVIIYLVIDHGVLRKVEGKASDFLRLMFLEKALKRRFKNAASSIFCLCFLQRSCRCL